MIWKSPTPHEESLEKIDHYVRDHVLTLSERRGAEIMFRGDKRKYGLRHLRLTAAVNRILALDGKPPIKLL